MGHNLQNFRLLENVIVMMKFPYEGQLVMLTYIFSFLFCTLKMYFGTTFTPSLASYLLNINGLECRICVWPKNISAKGNMLTSLRRKYTFGTLTLYFTMNMTQVKK